MELKMDKEFLTSLNIEGRTKFVIMPFPLIQFSQSMSPLMLGSFGFLVELQVLKGFLKHIVLHSY
jgi:hypothetical protein